MKVLILRVYTLFVIRYNFKHHKILWISSEECIDFMNFFSSKQMCSNFAHITSRISSYCGNTYLLYSKNSLKKIVILRTIIKKTSKSAYLNKHKTGSVKLCSFCNQIL